MQHWDGDECEIAARKWIETAGMRTKSQRFLAVGRAIGRTESAVRTRFDKFGATFADPNAPPRVAHNRKASGRRRPMSASEAAAMVAMWRAGANYSEIARRFERNKATVAEAVQAAVPKHERHAAHHGELRTRAIEESNDGRAKALRERDERMAAMPQTIVGVLMGDPAPGRSALDMRASR